MKNEWIDASQKPELERSVLVKIHTDIEKKNKYWKSSNLYCLKKEELTDTEQIMPGSWAIPQWAGMVLNNGNPKWCLQIEFNPEYQTIISWKYENNGD